MLLLEEHKRFYQQNCQNGFTLLNTPAKRALYNNMSQNEELALRINEVVRRVRPGAWLGVEPKERVIKAAMYAILHDFAEVERVFLIVKAQVEYQ